MISRAEEKDAASLERLITKEFAYKGLTAERIVERLRKPEIIVFKKTVEGQVVGFADVEVQGPTLFMNAISTDEKHRNRGYGKELMEHVIDYASNNGFERVELLVKKGNGKAKALYSKMGFRFLKFYRKVIEDSIVEVWEKPLNSNNLIA